MTVITVWDVLFDEFEIVRCIAACLDDLGAFGKYLQLVDGDHTYLGMRISTLSSIT